MVRPPGRLRGENVVAQKVRKSTGYPPPFNKNYVYLKTLQNRARKTERALFATASKELDNGFSTGGIFNKHIYRAGLDLLFYAMNNERMQEIALIKRLQGELDINDNLNFDLSDPVAFYKKMMEQLTKIFDAGQKIKNAITLDPSRSKGTQERAQRTTQRFYEILENEIYRIFTDPKFTAAISGSIEESFLTALNGGSDASTRTALENAILNSFIMLFNDDAVKSKILKFLEDDTENGRKLAEQLLRVTYQPSGFKKIDDIAERVNTKAKEIIKNRKERKFKQWKRLRHADVKGILQSVRGLGMESVGVLMQSMIEQITQVISLGKSRRKTDILSVIGEISINATDVIQKLYENNKLLDENNNRLEGDMFDFAKQLQLAYETTLPKIENITEKSFIIHTSVKDYETTGSGTISHSGGFEGGQMSLKTFGNFIETIGLQNIDFLMFALKNLSSEAVGDKNYETLINFLTEFIGAFVFDDGLTIYSEELQNKIGGNIVHLFFLNGTYYPFSLILSMLYQQLSLGIEQISSGHNDSLQGIVKIDIDTYSEYGDFLSGLSDQGVRGERRWEKTAKMTAEKTQINLRFLQQFGQLMKGITNI